MKNNTINQILTYLIASVWLVNGLVCKVLNLVPRHQEIVSEILGQEHARSLTILIGVSEIVMAIWIVSRYKSKINATLQIGIVAIMNLLEFFLVPDLLMWGRVNFLFALMFTIVVFYNEFILNKNQLKTSL